MKCNVMVVYDNGSQESAEPFLAKRGPDERPFCVGIRKFTDTVNGKMRNQKGLDLSDFVLWNVAIFDTETLEIVPEKVRIMAASDAQVFVDGDSVEE